MEETETLPPNDVSGDVPPNPSDVPQLILENPTDHSSELDLIIGMSTVRNLVHDSDASNSEGDFSSIASEAVSTTEEMPLEPINFDDRSILNEKLIKEAAKAAKLKKKLKVAQKKLKLAKQLKKKHKELKKKHYKLKKKKELYPSVPYKV